MLEPLEHGDDGQLGCDAWQVALLASLNQVAGEEGDDGVGAVRQDDREHLGVIAAIGEVKVHAGDDAGDGPPPSTPAVPEYPPPVQPPPRVLGDALLAPDHCPTSTVVDLKLVCACAIQDRFAEFEIVQGLSGANVGDGYVGIKFVLQGTAHDHDVLYRVHCHITLAKADDLQQVDRADGDRRIDQNKVNKFHKMVNASLGRLTRRLPSVSNFALKDAKPIPSEKDPNLVHRVIAEIHRSGLLNDKLRSWRRSALYTFGIIEQNRDGFHLSVDWVEACP